MECDASCTVVLADRAFVHPESARSKNGPVYRFIFDSSIPLEFGSMRINFKPRSGKVETLPYVKNKDGWEALPSIPSDPPTKEGLDNLLGEFGF